MKRSGETSRVIRGWNITNRSRKVVIFISRVEYFWPEFFCSRKRKCYHFPNFWPPLTRRCLFFRLVINSFVSLQRFHHLNRWTGDFDLTRSVYEPTSAQCHENEIGRHVGDFSNAKICKFRIVGDSKENNVGNARNCNTASVMIDEFHLGSNGRIVNRSRSRAIKHSPDELCQFRQDESALQQIRF